MMNFIFCVINNFSFTLDFFWIDFGFNFFNYFMRKTKITKIEHHK